MRSETSSRAGERRFAVPLITITLAVALLASAASAIAGGDPCKTKICRDDYRYTGGRCKSPRDWLTGAISYYDPPRPLCNPGWHVDGQYCVKDSCCFKPACHGDEKYEDGLCKSGPTDLGWRTHRTATCPTGWTLLRSSGWCRMSGCESVQPPPPAKAGGGAAPPPPAVAGGGAAPPPPAVAAGRSTAPPTVTGFSADACVDRGGQVTVEGHDFGGVQGTRVVVLAGNGISVDLRVQRWSSQAIIVIVPDDARIQHGQRYYIGIQDGQRHWLSNIDERITICRGLE
jgi:hypothetical protein